MMMKRYSVGIVAVFLPLVAETGFAQQRATKESSSRRVDIGLHLPIGKTEYVTDKGDKFELDRRRFGISAQYDVKNGKHVFGHFHRVMRSEIVDSKDVNGSGYEFGLGAGAKINNSTEIGVIPFVRFNYITEEFDVEEKASLSLAGKEQVFEKETRVELKNYDFVVGAMTEFYSTDMFTPYFGVEIFPLSEGELKAKARDSGAPQQTQRAAIDYERDDILNLVFGAKTKIDDFWVGGQAKLVSETTFALEGGFIF